MSDDTKSASSGWCILARINGWVGLVASSFLTALIARYWFRARESGNEVVEQRAKILLLISTGVSALFGVALYLLYKFPDYCRVMGMLTVGLILISALTGVMHSNNSDGKVNPPPTGSQ